MAPFSSSSCVLFVHSQRNSGLKVTIISSLQSHFEDNPRDLQVLRHDKVLQPGRVQPHLKHIPSYLGKCVCVCVYVVCVFGCGVCGCGGVCGLCVHTYYVHE